MFVARLTCSDSFCPDGIIAEAHTLKELETLACECGCGFEILGFPDFYEDDPAPVVIEFRTRPAAAELSEAA
jgi:hypothetical protein